MDWFTSDHHFGHAKIIDYCNRPFTDMDDMNAAMFDNWNAVVGKQDRVWHLGDFAFESRDHIEKLVRGLNGHIHLIAGGHDKEARRAKGFVSIDDYKELKINGQWIVMFHFPILSWNRSHHGAWHLHGHTHGPVQQFQTRLALNVDVDSHGYTPVSFDEVAEAMKDRTYERHNDRREP